VTVIDRAGPDTSGITITPKSPTMGAIDLGGELSDDTIGTISRCWRSPTMPTIRRREW